MQFYRRIPSMRDMTFFLERQALRYLPSDKEFNYNFARDVMTHKKKLLAISDVSKVKDFSEYQKLPLAVLWNKVQSDYKLIQYFPEYPQGYIPEKEYMFNIVNTLNPEIITNLMKLKRQCK